MTADTGNTLFTVPPRRGRAAPFVVAVWAILAVAFLAEVAPARAPEERLYDLYASADAYARSAAEARHRAVAVAAEDAARGPFALAGASRTRPAPAAAISGDPHDCSCP